MAKNPLPCVEVKVMLCDANDGVVSDDEEFDWFDKKKREDFLKRMDKHILAGGYFEIRPT